jgi:hypothetical protein
VRSAAPPAPGCLRGERAEAEGGIRGLDFLDSARVICRRATLVKRAVRVAAWIGLTAVVIGLLLFLNLGRVVRLVTTPRDAFAAERAPPRPDYADPRSWSALPERDDLADRRPAGAPAADQLRAPADVFYLHPTSYIGSGWNGPTDDVSLNEATDRVATGIQASAFNGCCAVYAPRFRQANGMLFTRPPLAGERALDLAYEDVRRAFDAFNAKRGAGRPFILAGHSQGTVLAERLLYEAVSGRDLRHQLVAAYLIGGRVTAAGLRERAPDIAACGAPDDLHCVAAWNARSPDYVSNAFDMHRPDGRERLCINPLSWRSDGALAPAALNLGAVFLERDPTPLPAFADAQCRGGTLIVDRIGRAPRDLPSRILDHVLGAGSYHAIEYQIFFMNLRQNAGARVAAYVAARQSAR